jgi:hypothetical protein
MRLYTVCVETQPILVMSADADTPMLDAFTTIPELMKANRDNQALWDDGRNGAPLDRAARDGRGHLVGEDLMSLTPAVERRSKPACHS